MSSRSSREAGSASIPRPCLDCGDPTTDGTRCEPCRVVHERNRAAHNDANRPTTAGRGYGAAWARLSRRARKLQPWCEDCGTSDDLTCDHTPEAWQRVAAGLPLRLVDVAVVCRSCNALRGAARGPKTRGEN